MKRSVFAIPLLVLAFLFSSCGLNLNKPDNVTIQGNAYKRAFIGELYPLDASFPNVEKVRVSGNAYYPYSESPFDCYIAYDRNAEPNVYFKTSQFDDAVSHYSNGDCFNFYCLIGNIHDESEQQIFEISGIDSSMFGQLLEFAKENDYNPFTSFNNEDGLIEVPVADAADWMADEIHFYKESKDGAFATSQAYTFKLHNDKLYLVYSYDFSNEEEPVMSLRDIPSEISDYFCSLLEQEQIIMD